MSSSAASSRVPRGLVDPVANGLWIAAKPEPPPAPEPTGINYVELLHHKREDHDV
jgi:hypothetical protein